jgi:hypothetical protein
VGTAVHEPRAALSACAEWAAPASPRLRDFDISTLRRALFFSDPAEAVYDPRLPVVPNLDHIIDDNVDRYPAELQTNPYLRKATARSRD